MSVNTKDVIALFAGMQYELTQTEVYYLRDYLSKSDEPQDIYQLMDIVGSCVRRILEQRTSTTSPIDAQTHYIYGQTPTVLISKQVIEEALEDDSKAVMLAVSQTGEPLFPNLHIHDSGGNCVSNPFGRKCVRLPNF